MRPATRPRCRGADKAGAGPRAQLREFLTKAAVQSFTATLGRAAERVSRCTGLELIEDSGGLVVSLPERATFAPASTQMTTTALELVGRVARR